MSDMSDEELQRHIDQTDAYVSMYLQEEPPEEEIVQCEFMASACTYYEQPEFCEEEEHFPGSRYCARREEVMDGWL